MKLPLLLFTCEALRCRLSKNACAERHVRAEAARKDADGINWQPWEWGQFVDPCRGCALGREHARELQTPAPNSLRRRVPFYPNERTPVEPPLSKRAPGARKCLRCGQKYAPSGVRQKYCGECSRSPRLVKLRNEHQHAYCIDCKQLFVPSNRVRLSVRVRCLPCWRIRRREQQNQWQIKKRQKPKEVISETCTRCHQLFNPKHKNKALYCPECRKQVQHDYEARSAARKKQRRQDID